MAGPQGVKEVLREVWRGIRKPKGGGEIVFFYSFLFEILGQFIKASGYSLGMA